MISRTLISAVALLGLATAQVTTDCNPLEKDCPADPALGTKADFNFSSKPDFSLWSTHVGSVDYDAEKGAVLSVKKQGDSPTLRTQFYFFFGRTELHIKAAPGRGIISSMMWLSDCLDEVDWEILGGNGTHASTNFFGKGLEDFTQGKYHPVKGGTLDDYHNYTTVWTKEKLEWHIDGDLIRTVLPAEANNTHNYPQTPMRLSLGIWAGGDPRLPEGTREWAGGDTDYNAGPYNMYVKSVTVEDYSTGKEYKYGDKSGNWDSIEVVQGEPKSIENLKKKPQEEEKSLGEKWDALPQGSKTAAYAGAGGAAAIGIAGLAFFFLRQRRRGAEENRTAEKDNLIHGRDGEDATDQGHEYSAAKYSRV